MKRIAVYLEAVPEGGGYFQYAEILLEALAELPPGTADIRCWCRGDVWPAYLNKLGLRAESAESKPRGWLRWKFKTLKFFAKMFPGPDNARRARLRAPTPQIQAWRPDILLLPQPSFFDLPARTRQITPIHDLMHIYESRFPEVGNADELASRARLFGGIARHCASILTDSPLGKEHVLAQYPTSETQVDVLPYAAPRALLEAAPRQPETPLPLKFLFYPAQFWEHKNHVRVVQALALARATCPDIHCVFCGSAKYSGYALFQKEVARLGLETAVTTLGYVDTPEMAWLYRHARALFMPTFFGPTNIPPLEAMALDCPVCISGIYAMPWQCGDAALYCDPESVDDMADSMRRLWQDDEMCARLRENGRRHHESWNIRHMKQTLTHILLRDRT